MATEDAVSPQGTSEAVNDKSPDRPKGPEREANSLARGKGSQAAERRFKALVYGCATFLVIVISLIGVELIIQAVPAIGRDKANFLFSSEWSTSDTSNMRFGVADLFRITLMTSILALVLAVPVSVGIATFLVQYVPRRLSRIFSTVIDLLAAVPSIVYGLWGFYALGPWVEPFASWLNKHLSWIFLFKDGNVAIKSTTVFVAGIVLAIMILPIITSISREALRQTPVMHQEAALALGATKWEVIRTTVLPYGRSGIIAGSMLALGRALGETVAVLLIVGSSTKASGWSLFDGGYTFASKIASGANEFSNSISAGAYISAGLVLFVLTFVVNAIARMISGGRVN